MTYTKQDTDPNTPISSDFGQHVQTQYEEAQADFEAGNWSNPTDLADAVAKKHHLPCPVTVTVTATVTDVGTDTVNIDPTTDFQAFLVIGLAYDATFGGSHTGTIKFIMSDDSEITIHSTLGTESGGMTAQDILQVINDKLAVSIKRVEVEVVGTGGASGTSSLEVTLFAYQY